MSTRVTKKRKPSTGDHSDPKDTGQRARVDAQKFQISSRTYCEAPQNLPILSSTAPPQKNLEMQCSFYRTQWPNHSNAPEPTSGRLPQLPDLVPTAVLSDNLSSDPAQEKHSQTQSNGLPFSSVAGQRSEFVRAFRNQGCADDINSRDDVLSALQTMPDVYHIPFEELEKMVVEVVQEPGFTDFLERLDRMWKIRGFIKR